MCMTEQQYIDLYAGPTFQIDFRYSRLMNNIFVTMMYGCGLPILFPIALVSLVVTYFVEIYMLFYIYRVPPAYDISLHKSKLMTMEYAGVLYFAFGFWQLSN